MYDYDLLPTSRNPKKRKDEWRAVRNLSTLGAELVECLEKLDAITPSGDEIHLLRRQLTNLSEGYVLTFTSIVCPAYTNPGIDYKVGHGLSTVASRALEVHLALMQLLARHEIRNVRSEVVMADMGVREFLESLKRSQEYLRGQAKDSGIEIYTPLLTEIDPPRWQSATEEGKVLVQSVSQGQIGAVRQVRYQLLQRWAGKRLTFEEADEIIRNQAREYASVGKYLAHPDRLILGVDATAMAPFLRLGTRGVSPVVYFRRSD